MSVSREDIKKALGEMPVLELVELINELEEAWGVSAAAPVAAAAALLVRLQVLVQLVEGTNIFFSHFL